MTMSRSIRTQITASQSRSWLSSTSKAAWLPRDHQNRIFSDKANPVPLPRMYRYYIDIHGQMFLYDTVPKNLTSCFKDPRFLNFFCDRIRPIVQHRRLCPPSNPPPDWHESPAFLASSEWSSDSKEAQCQAVTLALTKDYKWVSACQGEWNFIETAEYGTPIVFRGLEDDQLTWGGDRRFKLQIERLKVCPESGYLYHPSPLPHLAWYKKKGAEKVQQHSPYAPYSLLSSSLVLTNFSEGLDIESEDLLESGGGTVTWKGKTYTVSLLQDGDTIR